VGLYLYGIEIEVMVKGGLVGLTRWRFGRLNSCWIDLGMIEMAAIERSDLVVVD
jgi:hypothetical protein